MAKHKIRRVLVVDDEADIRMIVGLNLDLLGMEWGEANDGAEAIETLLRDQWDGVVLDLMMPNQDGFEVLHRLAEEGLTDELALVVLSAKHAPSTAIQALTSGAQAHLSKPFSPNAVAQLLQELIDMTPEERARHRQRMIERAGDLERLGVERV